MLAFLHTAAAHVPSFTHMVGELDATVPIRHVVREDLLAKALADGHVAESTRKGTQDEVKRLIAEGARVVLCTCSTLGDAAEATETSGARVLRVDRPMAEHAVSLQHPILLVAATPTAMAAAVTLLRQASGTTEPLCRELLCSAAWQLFQGGNQAGYAKALADHVQEHARAGDVVMLAQASMSAAAALIRRTDVEVLTSPVLGVKRAIALL